MGAKGAGFVCQLPRQGPEGAGFSGMPLAPVTNCLPCPEVWQPHLLWDGIGRVPCRRLLSNLAPQQLVTSHSRRCFL